MTSFQLSHLTLSTRKKNLLDLCTILRRREVFALVLLVLFSPLAAGALGFQRTLLPPSYTMSRICRTKLNCLVGYRSLAHRKEIRTIYTPCEQRSSILYPSPTTTIRDPHRHQCQGPNHRKHSTSQSNVARYENSKALQRVRLKGELMPMLSLAIQSFLKTKHAETSWKDDDSQHCDFTTSVKILAEWNGYHPIHASHLVVTNENSGRIDLASGLIAEASPFAAENYIVFAKTRQPQHTSSPAQETTTTTRQHPRFFLEDYSWYRALEARIDHNLDRWEANARKRSEQRRATAKQSLQRLFDSIQAPVSAAFGSVTARLGPVADRLHSMIQSEFGNLRLSLVASKVEPSPVDDDLSQQEQQPHRIEQTTSSKSVLPGRSMFS